MEIPSAPEPQRYDVSMIVTSGGRAHLIFEGQNALGKLATEADAWRWIYQHGARVNPHIVRERSRTRP